MLAYTPPAPWGDDKLSSFLDDVRDNVIASFVQQRSDYNRLRDIDDAFLSICTNLLNPGLIGPPLFLLQAHAAYRAAAGLSLGTQPAPAFMVMRGCLENSLYGLYVHRNEDAFERWTRREDSDECRRQVKNEFTIATVKACLREADPKTFDVCSQLYDRTIDRGAHPNFAGLVTALQMTENGKTKEYKVMYLTKDASVIHGTLRSLAQVGLCSLRIFRNVFRERFDLLGLTDELQKLGQGL